MQFLNAVDIRINILEREDMLVLVKQNFKKLCPDKGLKVYGILSASLKEFKTTSKGFDVEPAYKYRLLDEEIKPKEEEAKIEEEADQTPDDFMFENRGSICKKPKAVKVA